MTELRDNIFAIEVPEDFIHGEIAPMVDSVLLKLTAMNQSATRHSTIVLPPSSYEILFTTKKVSEEDAKKVVGKEGVHPSWPFNPLYTNYGNDRVYIDDARESLQSLLKSKGLTAGNYLIIKKVSL